MHYNYLNRRKHKIFMYKKKPLYIKTCLKLVNGGGVAVLWIQIRRYIAKYLDPNPEICLNLDLDQGPKLYPDLSPFKQFHHQCKKL